MYRLSSQYCNYHNISSEQLKGNSDYDSMRDWMKKNNIIESPNPYQGEDINGAIVLHWEECKKVETDLDKMAKAYEKARQLPEVTARAIYQVIKNDDYYHMQQLLGVVTSQSADNHDLLRALLNEVGRQAQLKKKQG